jgi:hypothetical protein
MFLIDIPFKGCQGRLNRSSIVHAVSYFACSVNDTACTVHEVSLIPHAVSMTPQASYMRCHWYRMKGACGVIEIACTRPCGVIDIACIFFAYHLSFAYDFNFSKLFENFCVHAVSIIPHAHVHAMSMIPHAPCMRCQWHRMLLKKIRISSRIRIYIRKGFSPLIRGLGRMFWWKNRGSKISWHCPFKLIKLRNNSCQVDYMPL